MLVAHTASARSPNPCLPLSILPTSRPGHVQILQLSALSTACVATPLARASPALPATASPAAAPGAVRRQVGCRPGLYGGKEIAQALGGHHSARPAAHRRGRCLTFHTASAASCLLCSAPARSASTAMPTTKSAHAAALAHGFTWTELAAASRRAPGSTAPPCMHPLPAQHVQGHIASASAARAGSALVLSNV